jgi:hypothetical protein
MISVEVPIPAAREFGLPLRGERSEMAKLRVDFQEGFADDEVEIKINGQESLHREGVTTKRMLGLASSSEIQVPSNQTVDVEIELPKKHLSKSISLPPSESVFLGVSVRDGEIKFTVSQKSFGYA